MKWPGQWILLALRQHNRFHYRLKVQRWKAVDYEIRYLISTRLEVRPTLVFLHGLGASKDQWGSKIYSLVDAYNCVFLDLPGEGESSYSNVQSYSPVAQVERLKFFFDAMGFKDVVLIGSSIGACIACLYAATYPADVSRLIAMAPAGLQAARPSVTMRRFTGEGEHTFGYRTVSEMLEFWDTVFTRSPTVPAFLAKALAVRGALRYPRIGKILADYESAGLYPLQSRLAEVQAKTLMIWGSNDRVFDISCLDEVARFLPQARVCVIHGAGHVPYVECGEQTLDAIQRFLSDGDQSSYSA